VRVVDFGSVQQQKAVQQSVGGGLSEGTEGLLVEAVMRVAMFVSLLPPGVDRLHFLVQLVRLDRVRHRRQGAVTACDRLVTQFGHF